MFRLFQKIFVIIIISGSYFTIYSQNYDTLYNQTSTPSGDLQLSSVISESGFGTTYSSYGADDFISNDQWTLKKIIVLGGFYNGANNSNYFIVKLYADDNPDGNLPGTQIYYGGNTVQNEGNGVITIPITDDVVLPAGHYWISVAASVVLGNAQWGWKPSSSNNYYEAVWENPGDGFGTGYTTWTPITTVYNGTTEKDYSFAIMGVKGTPASNPDPINNDLAVNLNKNISWNNPSNSDSIEVYWGTDPNNLTSIYSGVPITTIDQGSMDYYTKYYWKVAEINENGRSTAFLWNFTTILNPDEPLDADFEDQIFPAPGWSYGMDGDNWWFLGYYSAYGNGNYSAIQSFYSDPAGNQNSLLTQTFNSTGQGDTLSFDHAYATDLTNADDKLEIYYSTDAGNNWTSLVLLHGGSNGALVTAPPTNNFFDPDSTQWGTLKFAVPSGTNRFKFTAISANGNNLFIDNVKLNRAVLPVELTSFTALSNGNNVQLNWSTATEENNKGFEIERNQKLKSKKEWEKIGFVEGNGTTTEKHSYSFSDDAVQNREYHYRLKQIDFDGSYKYSKIVNVDVNQPIEYSLSQNYPNPFNPTTNIKYSISSNQFVTLKVYDVLGNEVKTLVSENKEAGNYTVKFDASNLASGIYFYRLKAGNFSSVKKLILLK